MRLLVIPIALAALPFVLGCGLCRNELLDRYPAPDKSLEVVVFQRDCGATTPFSTQVSIGKVGEGPKVWLGNILGATTDHGAAPAGKGGGPEVRVRWIDNRTLEIAHHAKASVGKPSTSYKGVTIRYVTFQAP